MNGGSKVRRTQRRAGKGTVVIIATLLAGSAVLRLGAGAGIADAGAAKPLAEVEKPEAAPAPSSKNSAAPATKNRAEIGRLLAALQAREARVAEREAQAEVRGKALAVAGEEIDKRMQALAKIEADLRDTLALADGAAEDDLARLTAVYESMKPKDAAKLFETMEPDFAAGFLGRMRPDSAAAVLTGLSAERAYSISVILAGRNATAPKS